jgi:hypothetical protein
VVGVMTPEQLLAQWFAYLELVGLEMQRITEDVAELLGL